MIKAVIFDFGQTLVDSAEGFRTAEKEAQEKIFGHMALSLREAFVDRYRRVRSEFHGRSDFSRPAMWREVYHFYCLSPDEGLLQRWEAEYWETVTARTRLFPETIRVLAALALRFQVALITNTQGQPAASAAHRLSAFPGLARCFRRVIVAGEEGIPPKPDPRPFLQCVRSLGIGAGQAVYVGDDWRIDVVGSRSAGLHPVWIRHESVPRNWPDVPSADVPVITRLDQLLALDLLQG
jgi:FMN phosphatase YigB (HAD superfamily)